MQVESEAAQPVAVFTTTLDGALRIVCVAWFAYCVGLELSNEVLGPETELVDDVTTEPPPPLMGILSLLTVMLEPLNAFDVAVVVVVVVIGSAVTVMVTLPRLPEKLRD